MSKFLVILSLLVSSFAFASEPLICTSELNKFGGYVNLVVAEKGGSALISGHASGGMAKFMAVFGPYEATKTNNVDSVTYTWTDQFNQVGKATIVTTNIAGKVVQTATSDYGMWSVGGLNCK